MARLWTNVKHELEVEIMESKRQVWLAQNDIKFSENK